MRRPWSQRAATTAWMLGVVLAAAMPSRAEMPGAQLNPKSAEGLPPELDGVGIKAQLGSQLPLDVPLVDQNGRAVKMADYVKGDRPVVLVFAYYTCPMLCTLVLNGTMDAMKASGLSPDKDYRVVTVSFDGRDTPELAQKKRDNYVRALGRPLGARDWDFLTGRPEDVKRLADAMGFSYRWVEAQKTFAHQAGIFVLTADGKLSRVLYGMNFAPADWKLALTEASKGAIGPSLADRVLLFCFHYSPTQGRYVLAATRLMRAAGALTVLIIGTWLILHFRGEKKRKAAAA